MKDTEKEIKVKSDLLVAVYKHLYETPSIVSEVLKYLVKNEEII